MSLSFSIIQKTCPSLIPGQTHEIEIKFQNSSEYDKQLYCTLLSPEGVLVSKKQFDLLVPAEGVSLDTIKITIPKDNRIFYSSYFFVLETKEAVLQENKNFAFFLNCALPWKWSVLDNSQKSIKEGATFLGKTHICKTDITYGTDKQCSLLLESQIACTKEECVNIKVCSQGECSIYNENICISPSSEEHLLTLSLHKGINKIFIKSSSCLCIISAEYTQNSDYVPSCINPDYYIN